MANNPAYETGTAIPQEFSVSIQTADAGAAGWIAYSVATWIAWAYLVGFVNQNALLLMACISLACTVPYLAAAITQLKMGNLAGGVTWMYFGAFFAFCSALTYAVTYFAGIYGWALDTRILGYMWAVLGLVLIMTTPIFLKFTPWISSVSVIGADVGIATLTLIYWGVTHSLILQLSGWSFFVAGFFGIWSAVIGLLGSVGIKFPTGEPLLK